MDQRAEVLHRCACGVLLFVAETNIYRQIAYLPGRGVTAKAANSRLGEYSVRELQEEESSTCEESPCSTARSDRHRRHRRHRHHHHHQRTSSSVTRGEDIPRSSARSDYQRHQRTSAARGGESPRSPAHNNNHGYQRTSSSAALGAEPLSNQRLTSTAGDSDCHTFHGMADVRFPPPSFNSNYHPPPPAYRSPQRAGEPTHFIAPEPNPGRIPNVISIERPENPIILQREAATAQTRSTVAPEISSLGLQLSNKGEIPTTNSSLPSLPIISTPPAILSPLDSSHSDSRETFVQNNYSQLENSQPCQRKATRPKKLDSMKRNK